MFYTIEELVTQANQKFDGSISELMIATEIETSGRTRNEILALMSENLNVMLASINNGMTERTSRTGLTGGDALKLDSYIKNGKTLSDTTVLSAARNAMAVNESNAQMGLVCATPTAGSAGCIPAVLSTAIDKLQLTQTQQLDFCSLPALSD
jgi:L-serine dehydratase